jgi:hypothetical protein
MNAPLATGHAAYELASLVKLYGLEDRVLAKPSAVKVDLPIENNIPAINVSRELGFSKITPLREHPIAEVHFGKNESAEIKATALLLRATSDVICQCGFKVPPLFGTSGL